MSTGARLLVFHGSGVAVFDDGRLVDVYDLASYGDGLLDWLLSTPIALAVIAVPGDLRLVQMAGDLLGLLAAEGVPVTAVQALAGAVVSLDVLDGAELDLLCLATPEGRRAVALGLCLLGRSSPPRDVECAAGRWSRHVADFLRAEIEESRKRVPGEPREGYCFTDEPATEESPQDDPRALADALRLLGLHPNADEAVVRRAYKAQARKAHPDAGGSNAAFGKLAEARDLVLRALSRGRASARATA